MKKLVFPSVLAAILLVSPADAQRQQSQPAQQAQPRSYELGPLWTVSMIDVEDGQFENYMDFLRGQYRSNQEYARQQGWILDWDILENVNARPGEPDLFLITRYRDFPNVAEIERRDQIMLRRMQTDARTAEQQSGARVVMRKQLGSMMLRELELRR